MVKVVDQEPPMTDGRVLEMGVRHILLMLHIQIRVLLQKPILVLEVEEEVILEKYLIDIGVLQVDLVLSSSLTQPDKYLKT
jgi:hypothetical protein